MRTLVATLKVIVEIAIRNLIASRWKSAIVAGLIAFGALLATVGSSLLNSVDRSIGRSITGSITGHIQVYSAQSTEELQVMGSVGGDIPNLAPLDDFAQLRGLLLGVPNVSAVVPMGLKSGFVSSGNTVDQALGNLRLTVNARQRDSMHAQLASRYEAQKAHVRQMLLALRRELENAQSVSAQAPLEDIASIDRAASAEFWSGFDRDPYAHLEFLENHVATIAADADILILSFVGTDPAAFSRAFDRMEIVDGELIPAGQRGFMFSKYVYEEWIKLKVARGLDKLKIAIDEHGAKIADDMALRRVVHENTMGVNDILLQLDAEKLESFRAKLRKFLHSTESDVGKLLALFLATDDTTFHERYRFFYAALAPELQLYRVMVGDTLTLQTFTRSGYVRSANLKVYGTFNFKGLEQSPQAGATNMMDLVSFRELYGFMTPEHQREIEAMRAHAGSRDVSREDAEAELFGSKPASFDVAPLSAGSADAFTELGARGRRERHGLANYDPKQLEQGVILNAAVVLKDESQIDATMRAIEQAGKRASLPLKAVHWQAAAGILGQLATLSRAVLFSAVLIIFVVALVVINNALVMAMLERVREIGTLRAIGAQRRFILGVVLVESIAIGIASGVFGAALGGLALLVLGKTGIAAGNDALRFVFAGHRLFPTLGPQDLWFALVAVLAVSVVSALYPAWFALRISPREAMASQE